MIIEIGLNTRFGCKCSSFAVIRKTVSRNFYTFFQHNCEYRSVAVKLTVNELLLMTKVHYFFCCAVALRI
jgi:hypothetical protein